MRLMSNVNLIADRETGFLPPITIMFMLACYFTPEPENYFGKEQWNSAAGFETRNWLMKHELIDSDFRATSRGQSWVRYICRTPLPVPSWILPERLPAGD